MVRFSNKIDLNGLSCIIKDEKVIVVNKSKPIEQKLKILASCFNKIDLNGVYIVPALRAYIMKVLKHTRPLNLLILDYRLSEYYKNDKSAISKRSSFHFFGNKVEEEMREGIHGTISIICDFNFYVILLKMDLSR